MGGATVHSVIGCLQTILVPNSTPRKINPPANQSTDKLCKSNLGVCLAGGPGGGGGVGGRVQLLFFFPFFKNFFKKSTNDTYISNSDARPDPPTAVK